jgi:hypothetical protein
VARNPAFNEYNQFPNQDDPRQVIVKLDYNITDKWRVSGRLIDDPQPITSVYGEQNSGKPMASVFRAIRLKPLLPESSVVTPSIIRLLVSVRLPFELLVSPLNPATVFSSPV